MTRFGFTDLSTAYSESTNNTANVGPLDDLFPAGCRVELAKARFNTPIDRVLAHKRGL